MSSLTVLAILIGAGILAYFIGRLRSIQVCGGEQYKLHSRPTYHGYYLAIMTALPAIILLAAWSIAERPVTRYVAMQELGPRVLQGTDAQKSLTMSVVDTIAEGLPQLGPEEYEVVRKARLGFVTASDARDVLGRHGVVLGSDPDRTVLAAADELASARATSRILLPIACFGLAVLGFLWGYTRIRTGLRSRNITESVIRSGLFVASTVAVLTTVGIVLSVLFETIHFFQYVSPVDFLFGTVWDPRFATVGQAEGQFGLLPLLWGTLFISAVALLVAVPVGLFAAIYMSEYAGARVRAFAKPVLEILAGIPTIVYGFFALSVFGPLLRDLGFNIGLEISASSVLTAGIVMGVMIIPFVSSLSDDIINAVPQSLREGSYGLGATQSETIKKVILPAALPGIVGACLLAASRAI
ncbi:MAG: phosphate ABC transporter permease subunit PstC, partial [Pseudomonadota bacterium]